MNKQQIFEQARSVLVMNDAGTHTRPAPGLYPHQWLWDSGFIAIGIARYDAQRAAQEIYSLLEGQWSNGMIPHMIFASEDESGRSHNLDARFWKSSRSPHAPKNRKTSGITQPPVLAESALRVAQAMKKDQAVAFLKQVYPHLVEYHRWLYHERDPDQNGIVALFHPWETGLDNAPAWMEELSKIHTPLWIKTIDTLKIDWIIERLFRRDIKRVKSDERMSTTNALRLTHVALGLRKRSYDTEAIMRRPDFVIESLSFNSILIGNNRALKTIAKVIGQEIPEDLNQAFERAKAGLQGLWNEEMSSYCHRNYLTGHMEPITGIAKLLPLYAGCLTSEQAEALVAEVRDANKFGLPYPAPSVSKESKYFNPRKYWQGPTWINTNWLLIQGLRLYGYNKEADTIKQASLNAFADNGSYEYFNPETGEGLGAENFSWTAALILDLVSE